MDVFNWSALITTFLGSFFGFGFALIVQSKTKSKSQKETIENANVLFREEIRDTIKVLKKRVYEGTTVDFEIITPSYDSMIASGTLVKLVSSRTLYNKIIASYSKIWHFNRGRSSFTTEENKAQSKELLLFLEKIVEENLDGH